MADDGVSIIGLLQWIGNNPEKGALVMVILAGVWQYIREFRNSLKADENRESFTDTLIRENKELLKENKDLRAELREGRWKQINPSDSNSERAP